MKEENNEFEIRAKRMKKSKKNRIEDPKRSDILMAERSLKNKTLSRTNIYYKGTIVLNQILKIRQINDPEYEASIFAFFTDLLSRGLFLQANIVKCLKTLLDNNPNNFDNFLNATFLTARYKKTVRVQRNRDKRKIIPKKKSTNKKEKEKLEEEDVKNEQKELEEEFVLIPSELDEPDLESQATVFLNVLVRVISKDCEKWIIQHKLPLYKLFFLIILHLSSDKPEDRNLVHELLVRLAHRKSKPLHPGKNYIKTVNITSNMQYRVYSINSLKYVEGISNNFSEFTMPILDLIKIFMERFEIKTKAVFLKISKFFNKHFDTLHKSIGEEGINNFFELMFIISQQCFKVEFLYNDLINFWNGILNVQGNDKEDVITRKANILSLIYKFLLEKLSKEIQNTEKERKEIKEILKSQTIEHIRSNTNTDLTSNTINKSESSDFDDFEKIDIIEKSEKSSGSGSDSKEKSEKSEKSGSSESSGASSSSSKSSSSSSSSESESESESSPEIMLDGDLPSGVSLSDKEKENEKEKSTSESNSEKEDEEKEKEDEEKEKEKEKKEKNKKKETIKKDEDKKPIGEVKKNKKDKKDENQDEDEDVQDQQKKEKKEEELDTNKKDTLPKPDKTDKTDKKVKKVKKVKKAKKKKNKTKKPIKKRDYDLLEHIKLIFLILSRNNPKFTVEYLIKNLTIFPEPPKDINEYLQWINTKNDEITPYHNASLFVLDEIIYENDQEVIPYLPILIQHLIVYDLNVEILRETKEKLLSFLINSLGIRYSTNEESFMESTEALYRNYIDPCTQLVLKENPKLKFVSTDSFEKIKTIRAITNLPLKNGQSQGSISVPDLDNLPDIDKQSLPNIDLNIPLPETKMEIETVIDEFDKTKYPFEHKVNKISKILINFNGNLYDQWGQIALNCAIKTSYQNIAINSLKAFYTVQQEYNPTLLKFLSAITITSLDQNVHIYKTLIDIIEKIIKLKSNTFKGIGEWIILANLSSSLLFINQSEIFEKGLQFLNLIFKNNKLKKKQIANAMVQIWKHQVTKQDSFMAKDPRNDKEINFAPEQIININKKQNEEEEEEEEEEKEKEKEEKENDNNDDDDEDENDDDKKSEEENSKEKSKDNSDEEDSESEKETKKKKKNRKRVSKKKKKKKKKKEDPLPIIKKTKPSQPKVIPLIQVQELPQIKFTGNIIPIDLQIIRTIFKGFSLEKLINPTLELVINLIESFSDHFTTGNNFLLSSILLMIASKHLTNLPKEQEQANLLLNRLFNLKLNITNQTITVFKQVFEFKDETQFLKQFFHAYSKLFSGELQFSFGINSLLHLLKYSDTDNINLKTIWLKMIIWLFSSYGLIWTSVEFLNMLNTCKYYGYSEDENLNTVANKCYSLLVIFAHDINNKNFSNFVTSIPNLQQLRKSTKKFDNSQISIFLSDNIEEMIYKDQGVFKNTFKNLVTFLMK
ncbi:chascon [Anaeramoeba flamelloides]|uniref:Chascon n=1 Tax=Anaeramoeba flamelloides TaxID=1746091 RepID=A0ABQ8Z5B1_9EUKA|nr:chascon [Anaeramoeba flamelloides]